MRRVLIDSQAPQRVEPRSRKRRRSSGELAKRARIVQERIDATVAERQVALLRGGRSPLLAYRQDDPECPVSLPNAYQDRRVVAADVRREAGATHADLEDAIRAAKTLHVEATPDEGAEFFRGDPERAL